MQLRSIFHRLPPAALRLSLFASLVALLLAPLAAQRPAPAPRSPQPVRPPVERRVPFAVGETLSYDVSWSSFLTAATATIVVRDKKPSYGSVAYYIAAEGNPTSIVAMLYPLYYKADTLVDVYTLLPQRASLFSRERSRQQIKETLFDQARHTATFSSRDMSSRGTVPLAHTFRLPAAAQDPLSVVFWLRTLDLKTGMKVPVTVVFNDSVYNVELIVRGRETVSTGVGARPAWRINPVVVGENKNGARQMTVWVSDDRRRLPLRMEVELAVGRFELTLTGVRP